MSTLFAIPVSPAGMLAAAAFVVAGGPLFADGLRALRQRRLLSGLSTVSTIDGLEGFARVAGTVALESPLFSPLSQKPCAGYRLEVHALDSPVAGEISQQRGFRLVAGAGSAFVEPSGEAWRLPVTAEREVRAGEAVSANMSALLERDVTLRWLRDRRAPMRIVERSLEAGARVEVLGHAYTVAVGSAEAQELLAATGTDGLSWAVTTTGRHARPALRLTASEPLGLHVVATGDADPRRFAPSGWRTAGVVLGPLLCLAGLVYLLHAADATLGGRF